MARRHGVKIFWSWQDDSPAKTNRTFIKEALAEAIKSIEGDFEFEDAERPELDHDTKGVAGAAEIVPTVMAKIAESVVFVADVTPIIATDHDKALPNPNVMVELGWSLHKPGPARQIYVLNTAEGWTIEGLPFDIRHRRVLTYSLAETADAKTRERVKRSLTKSLAGAISANLQAHLDEKVQVAAATGLPSQPSDPSIWASAGATFSHHDAFGDGFEQTVEIAPPPRAYLRVIPTGWRDGPPGVAVIARLPDAHAPRPVSEGSMEGDFGATEEGYVRYWRTGRTADGGTITANMAMYLQDTGEFWFTQGLILGEDKGRKILRHQAIVSGWLSGLRRANVVMNRLGAFPARRVEVGIVGLKGVHWNGGIHTNSPSARRPTLKVERQQRDWTAEKQRAFVGDAFVQLCDLFALDKPHGEPLARFILGLDHDRPDD